VRTEAQSEASTEVALACKLLCHVLSGSSASRCSACRASCVECSFMSSLPWARSACTSVPPDSALAMPLWADGHRTLRPSTASWTPARHNQTAAHLSQLAHLDLHVKRGLQVPVELAYLHQILHHECRRQVLCLHLARPCWPGAARYGTALGHVDSDLVQQGDALTRPNMQVLCFWGGGGNEACAQVGRVDSAVLPCYKSVTSGATLRAHTPCNERLPVPEKCQHY
jgi:hypothetical protein